MKSHRVVLQWLLSLTIFLTILHLCTADEVNSVPESNNLDRLLSDFAELRHQQKKANNTIIVDVLSFTVAFVCSAAGVGAGPLFLTILNLIGGIDLKAASSFSAFMVTGVLLSNVVYHLFFGDANDSSGRPLINYNLTLLAEPCLLLGVSLGVICNVVFPEWLVVVLFVLFLGYSTYRTWKTGVRLWKSQADGLLSRSVKIERSRVLIGDQRNDSVFDSLLGEKFFPSESRIPWKDMLFLVSFWGCFLILQIFKEDEDISHVKPCGVVYWLVNSSQIPLAIVFTALVLKKTGFESHRNAVTDDTMSRFSLPKTALLTGILGGLFGVGGGLFLSPLLLDIGLHPQAASATTTFMLFFSVSMSAFQHAILGTIGIKQASIYGLICFTGSAIGLSVVQKTIKKSGRAYMVVFAVTGVMTLSLIVMSFGGVVDCWQQYKSGEYMGFKTPC